MNYYFGCPRVYYSRCTIPSHLSCSTTSNYCTPYCSKPNSRATTPCENSHCRRLCPTRPITCPPCPNRCPPCPRPPCPPKPCKPEPLISTAFSLYPSADDDNGQKKKKTFKKKKQDKTKVKPSKNPTEETVNVVQKGPEKDEKVLSVKNQSVPTEEGDPYDTETIIMGKVDENTKGDSLPHTEEVQETANGPSQPDQTKPDTEQNALGKGDEPNNSEADKKNMCTPREPAASLCTCKKQKNVCTPITFGMNLCTNCLTKKMVSCNRPGLSEPVGGGKVCSTCSKRKTLERIKCSTCGCEKSKVASPLIVSNQLPFSKAVYCIPCKRCSIGKSTHFSHSVPQETRCSTDQSKSGKGQSCTCGKMGYSKPMVQANLLKEMSQIENLDNTVQKPAQNIDESSCKQVFPAKCFPTAVCKSGMFWN